MTFLEDYVFRSKVTRYSYERRAETVLHEMAHMWFGDLVTMAWWDDLWLNESFATFASVLCQTEATEYTNAWTTFANVEKSWAYVQDQLPSTHPIAADMADLRPSRSTSTGSPTPRALGAQAVGRLRRVRASSSQDCARTSGARLRQRDVRGSPCRTGEVLRPRPVRLGSDSGSTTTGLNILSARLRGRRRRAGSPGSPSARRAPHPVPASGGRTDSRSASTTTIRTASWCERNASSSTSMDATARTSPSWSVSHRGALVLVNDDDLTVLLRCASTPNRWDGDRADRRHRRLTPPHPGLVRGWEMTRQAELLRHATSSRSSSAASVGDRGRCGATASAPERHTRSAPTPIPAGQRPTAGELRRSVARTGA